MNLRTAIILGLTTATSLAADVPGKGGKLVPSNRAEDHPPKDTPDAVAKNLARMKVQPGFKAETWAGEPMLANPVAFCFDDKGRLFTSETNRYRTSVLDIRNYYWMIEDDLAARNQDEWTASIKRNFPTDWQQLEKETEVIRMLEDTDGDGKADKSSVYASGFNSILDGIASGVMWHKDALYFTNIPALWKLNGADKAEKREEMFRGFGVRFSYTGHDFHGLIVGPDGRIYFSIGDRGASLKTKEGASIEVPDEGAVFRCEADGSHLELVMRGLRNPQELAFDDYGNLFTGDNDSDQGDRERWVAVTEGADAGWRVGYQHHPLGNRNNPWLVERMWEPRDPQKKQPSYILPPVANITDGPSGLVCYPGTGMPEEYAGSFFLANFKGSGARSGVSTFKCEPDGAGFKLTGLRSFINNVQATDVDFGPDSRFYVSAWDDGWDRTNQGRIYTCFHPAAREEQAAQIAEVKDLLAKGFSKRSGEELVKLTAHPDRRVRLGAQWALADRVIALTADKNHGDLEKLNALVTRGITTQRNDRLGQLSRLHLLQAGSHAARLIARKDAAKANGSIVKMTNDAAGHALFRDPEPAIRIEMLRAFVDLPGAWDDALRAEAVRQLADPAPRVRFFAAMALAKKGKAEDATPVIALLRENDGKDVYLQHAGVMALAGVKNMTALDAAAKDESRAVRLAALLAYRNLGSELVARFLTDKDPELVREAAIAINDAPIPAAMPALAKLASGENATIESHGDLFAIRVLNANFRVGDKECAGRLAQFAAGSKSEGLRMTALKMLSTWDKPPARDFVAGTFRPLPARAPGQAASALSLVAATLLEDKSERVAIAACDALSGNRVKDAAPQLLALVKNLQAPAKARAAALNTLAAIEAAELTLAAAFAAADTQPALKTAANRLLGKGDPAAAAKMLAAAYAAATPEQKRDILNALGDNQSTAAGETLVGLLRDAAKQPASVQLELVEAAQKHPSSKEAAAAWKASLPKADPLAAFRHCLEGGDAARGKVLFMEHPVAACNRCHKVSGTGGDAGPDMTGFAAKHDRAYILESIVNVNAKIAPGFEMFVFTMKDGSLKAGVLKGEKDGIITLQNPGMPAEQIKAADVAKRESGPSGMPPNLGEVLPARDIRDIIEYVASLK